MLVSTTFFKERSIRLNFQNLIPNQRLCYLARCTNYSIPKKNKILLKKKWNVQIKFRESTIFTHQPFEPADLHRFKFKILRGVELFLAKLLAIWHQRTVCCFQERRFEKAQHATEKGVARQTIPLKADKPPRAPGQPIFVSAPWNNHSFSS